MLKGEMASQSEPFISEETKKRFGQEEWSSSAHGLYKERINNRRVMEWRLYGNILMDLYYNVVTKESEESSASIDKLHGVDFLNKIIPEIIKRKKIEGKKAKILDLGCSFGFSNDQIRTKFGADVEVFGTSIVKGDTKKRKRKFYRFIKEKLDIPEEKRQQLLSEISENLHPNDAKWRSIIEMHNYPEFDLIIDNCGELLYSGMGFLPQQRYFNQVLHAAIQKLNPEGQLYIAQTHGKDIQYHKEKLESKYPVTVEKNEKGFYDTAYIITKKK